jgi:hypothetical protein
MVDSGACLAVAEHGGAWAWVTNVGELRFNPLQIVSGGSSGNIDGVIYVPGWNQFVVVGQVLTTPAVVGPGTGGGPPGSDPFSFVRSWVSNFAAFQDTVSVQVAPGIFQPPPYDLTTTEGIQWLEQKIFSLMLGFGLPPPSGQDGLANPLFVPGYPHVVPAGDILQRVLLPPSGPDHTLNFSVYVTNMAFTQSGGYDASGIVGVYSPPAPAPPPGGSTAVGGDTYGPVQVYTSPDGFRWSLQATHAGRFSSIAASQTPFQLPWDVFPAGTINFR